MFILHLDLGPLINLDQQLQPAIDRALKRAAEDLTAQTHAHVVERVQQKLHSTRETYLDHLGFHQVNDFTWVVDLMPGAMFIEDGMCVVYGPAEKHQPKVFTPDGWVRVTGIIPGMLVLNQHGKWTKVLEVFDNPLLDFAAEAVDEDKTKRKYGYISSSLNARSHKMLVLRCLKCGADRPMSKYDWSRTRATYCPKCSVERDLVTLRVRIQGTQTSLTLTGDHQVATPRGWVRARDLEKTDHLLVPSWGACPSCQGPVPYGREIPCSTSCGSSLYQNKAVAAGTHVSQRPDWLSSIYSKTLRSLRKISGAEEAVVGVLRKSGQTVEFYKDGVKADWLRQYPVPSSIDRLGRQKYYFLDFYNERLKLALEVDGKAFHTAENDSVRDRVVREFGIQTVRVPATQVRSKQFELETLPALLANHEGQIVYREATIVYLKKRSWCPDLCFTRRWDIRVEDGESFVCQGVLIHNSSHSMVDDLLDDSPRPGTKRKPGQGQGKTHTAKDGSRWRVVPFQHNKAPTSQTQAGRDLTASIKQELKRLGAPSIGKLETGSDGKPLTGLVRSFDIMSKPLKTAEGPGQGHGPVGVVRQGPTGIPLLQGVRIYQRQVMDKAGKSSIKKAIMTFRIVSSKHKEQNRWIHPGLEARAFFTEAAEWALSEWESKIKNDVLDRLVAEL